MQQASVCMRICASEVYGILVLLKINEVHASKSFYRLLVMFSWLAINFVDLQNKL